MTSAMMLVVCASLFLATRSHAVNTTDYCQKNDAGAFLANDTCDMICNGTNSSKGSSKAPDETKCLLSDRNNTGANEDGATAESQGDKTREYGVCRNDTCVQINATNPEDRTTRITNGANLNQTTTTPKTGSTNATNSANPSTTSNSSAATTPSTMVNQSTTSAPGNITTTPAGSGHSRLAASVVSVALAIGALLCHATYME
ncbi:uncharacterized protein DDB_G0284459 isoform X2 [Rhipicephalus sanguineus]|uniref:uncharacterized protein DDB_G0284459 isoform X2 n=1 Tax=Rhipicephalus sanguineus TaxID=34632 RepID=UPI0018951947|nr:uncharacterized protein DDB_G0284459 isoform X2 [Rhipicephalus sanguineus]